MRRQSTRRSLGSRTRPVLDGKKLATTTPTSGDVARLDHWSGKRAAQLEGLPGWFSASTRDEVGQDLAVLQQYVAREGDASVPDTHFDEGDEWLPAVGHQRANRGQRRAHREDAAVGRRVETLPGWSWARRSSKWEQAFEALTSTAAREGHTTVPAGHIRTSINTRGSPVSAAQRVKGQLERHRTSRLEALPGWRWTGPVRRRMGEADTKAGALRPAEGHAPARLGTSGRDGIRLSPWIREQETRYEAGLMPPERIARLQAVPGWRWEKTPRATHPRPRCDERRGSARRALAHQPGWSQQRVVARAAPKTLSSARPSSAGA